MIGFVNNSHNYNVTRSWQKINSIEIEAQPQLPRLHSYINVIVTTFPLVVLTLLSTWHFNHYALLPFMPLCGSSGSNTSPWGGRPVCLRLWLFISCYAWWLTLCLLCLSCTTLFPSFLGLFSSLPFHLVSRYHGNSSCLATVHVERQVNYPPFRVFLSIFTEYSFRTQTSLLNVFTAGYFTQI